jgi:hypothetical protein
MLYNSFNAALEIRRNMAFQNDIVAYDATGKPVLAVEVKNKRGTNSEWAAQIRRNLLVHGLVADARYFLLALPDRFYLWVDKQQPEIIAPDYNIDPIPFFELYFELVGVPPENLTGIGFEMLVQLWLNELMRTDELPENMDWLIQSGLWEAIKQGHLASEIAV